LSRKKRKQHTGLCNFGKSETRSENQPRESRKKNRLSRQPRSVGDGSNGNREGKRKTKKKLTLLRGSRGGEDDHWLIEKMGRTKGALGKTESTTKKSQGEW